MSLYNKIRIIFLVTTLLLTAFFASYFYIKKGQHLQDIQKRYMQTSLFTLKHFRDSRRDGEVLDFSDENFQLFLKESNFELVLNPKEKEDIYTHAIRLMKRSIMRVKMEILRKRKHLYLSLHHPRFQVLLKDQYQAPFPILLISLYLLSLLFLLGLYLWLTKSLKPLKRLQQQIQKVAEGELSVSVKSQKSDEIAQVANAFDDALRKLESLINSRQLFLRTIMHELKTPIGKGRLLNEFLVDERQKDSYDAVFERLELLIEEFSKIEQMLSSSYQLKIASYSVQEMLDQALELMIMDEEQIEKQIKITQIEPFVLKTDFELFALALKNLIDNGLKYSPNHQIDIKIYKNRIEISNEGQEFMKNLEEFTQPFNPKGQGLGLGLYIVQNIMELLRLDLGYLYSSEKNVFIIK